MRNQEEETLTLFETVFSGNDAVYGLTENAINAATKQSAFQILLTAYLATMQ